MSSTPKIRKKKKLGSYPYITVIFSVSLALFTLGVFGLILIYGNTLSESIQNNHQVQVFLQNDLPDSQVNHIKSVITSKKYVSDASLTTKEEAKNKFISDDNEDPEALLGFNPLHDYFTIIIKGDYSNKKQLPIITTELGQIRGVFEVEYLEDFINIINSNIQKIGMVLLIICVMLILIVFILINNTIKLALFSQRFIIRSMQLVGATSWFIQKPFLWRAIWQGMISAWIASTALFSLTQFAKGKIEDLILIENMQHILLLFISLLVIGALIGFLSSYTAIKKYLRLSLDELY